MIGNVKIFAAACLSAPEAKKNDKSDPLRFVFGGVYRDEMWCSRRCLEKMQGQKWTCRSQHPFSPVFESCWAVLLKECTANVYWDTIDDILETCTLASMQWTQRGHDLSSTSVPYKHVHEAALQVSKPLAEKGSEQDIALAKGADLFKLSFIQH